MASKKPSLLRPPSLKVVRVRTKETLARFEEHQLVLRALRAIEYPGAHPVEIFANLFDHIEQDSRGLFIGYADGKPLAIVVALLPDSPLMMGAQVLIAYNESSPALAKAVSRALARWLKDADFPFVFAVNLNREDAVFIRGLRYFGRPTKVASLVRFDLE